MMLASFAGCMVTRTASTYAFSNRKRSMVAGDMVEHLGIAMDMLFDHQQAATQGLQGASADWAVARGEH